MITKIYPIPRFDFGMLIICDFIQTYGAPVKNAPDQEQDYWICTGILCPNA